ncbi:hypothetical protein BH10ACI3_BH10ACI3_27190 [soil metagenome]
MKTPFILIIAVATAALFAGCGAPAGNAPANNANKPANAAANTATAPAADKAAVEADIKKMMDDFAGALNKADVATLDKMYSDDYTLIDANGVAQTKAARMDSIKSGKVKMEGLKFEDLKIKTNAAGDGAVVTGHVTGKTTVDGKAEENNSMVTWVLGKNKDKGWQFVNAQITNIKAVAAPAKTDNKATDEAPKAAAPASNK